MGSTPDRSGFLSAQGRVPGFHTSIEVRGLCPVTAALAHRLRHDDESLPPSDPEPRTACEKCRRPLRPRQFPPGPACLCPRRSKYSIVNQALNAFLLTGNPAFPLFNGVFQSPL